MNQAWLNAIQMEIQRQALIALLFSIVCFAATMWVLYMVVKAAIRDGSENRG